MQSKYDTEMSSLIKYITLNVHRPFCTLLWCTVAAHVKKMCIADYPNVKVWDLLDRQINCNHYSSQLPLNFPCPLPSGLFHYI